MQYLILILILTAVGGLIYRRYKKEQKRSRELEKSLEDERLEIPGVGKVHFEELGDFAKGDPDAYKAEPIKGYQSDESAPESDLPIKDLPLTEERRSSIDDAFLYLQELLGKTLLFDKPVIVPGSALFPAAIHDLSEITPLAHTIARIMDIDPESIELEFFEEGVREFNPETGDMFYYEHKDYAGLYHGKNERGKYVVSVSDDIHKEMERLIATIAHEFSHIKLLGEDRMKDEDNSEELTDMVPLFYGLAIFNANSSFLFDKHHKGWSHSRLGYLGQADWGYLFALYLHVRGEEKPKWFSHLNRTIARDCERAMEFIQDNPDKILQPAN
jgi:hypothetical protein